MDMKRSLINLFMGNYYDFLVEYGNNNAFNKRAFHLLSDHKALWKLRIEYLMHQSLINENVYDKFKPLFQSLENDSLIVRNKMIKYGICNTNKNFYNILSGCEALREKDYKVMSLFCNSVDILKQVYEELCKSC